ncbi:DUF305 domain-containing protein [Micromonospora sp. NPDC050397]|uniref:DUF305 domain-containing protein n=1 Tax=Micromonospora sp. NPDC050397 TaxID=3364279 RepID=UPI003850A373
MSGVEPDRGSGMTASSTGKRGWRLVGVVAILVTTALTVSLAQGWLHGGTRAKAVQPAASPTVAPVVLSGTDVAFVQLMIPMDDRALVFFSYLDTAEGVTPALRELAGRLARSHRAEVADLRSLLNEGGVAEENIHEGHQMPGMITELRLDDLKAAPAGEFGRRAVTLIQEHLAQGASLSRSEQKFGGSERAKALAAALEQARNEELALLKAVPQG